MFSSHPIERLRTCLELKDEKSAPTEKRNAARFFFLNINGYLFLMFIFERDKEVGGGAEKEGDTESEPGSELSAQSPMWGPNPRTVTS